MSIDTGMPDIDSVAMESDKSEDEIEIQDSSKADLKKKANAKFW